MHQAPHVRFPRFCFWFPPFLAAGFIPVGPEGSRGAKKRGKNKEDGKGKWMETKELEADGEGSKFPPAPMVRKEPEDFPAGWWVGNGNQPPLTPLLSSGSCGTRIDSGTEVSCRFFTYNLRL